MSGLECSIGGHEIVFISDIRLSNCACSSFLLFTRLEYHRKADYFQLQIVHNHLSYCLDSSSSSLIVFSSSLIVF